MTTEQNSAALRPPPPPADTHSPAGRASTPPSLVTFTLLRGGPTSADYEWFTSSRRCLGEAIGDAVDYDDVAFHEGNVPRSVQLSLRLKMYTTPPRVALLSLLSRRSLCTFLVLLGTFASPFGRRPPVWASPRSPRRHRLRFVDAREHGGFDEAANIHVPNHANGSWLEYSLGYRHMVCRLRISRSRAA